MGSLGLASLGVATFLAAVGLFHAVTGTRSLQFPDAYHATGEIYLPYGDIAEPFEAWVDMNTGNSRMDTYNGELAFNSCGIGLELPI